jgi:hypothetical protein
VDTAIEATGAVADHWLDIAQASAGPPGAGRQPSQPDQASTDQTSTDQAE